MLTDTTRRPVRPLGLLAGALTLGVLLTACSDETQGSGSSGRLGVSSGPAATAPGSGATSPDSGSSAGSDAADNTTDAADNTTDAADNTTDNPIAAGTPLSQIVVQRSEVPSRFSSQSANNSPGETTSDDALHACLGIPATSGSRDGREVSSSFGTDDASVSSFAVRYTSDAAATTDAGLFTRPKARACFKAMLDKQAAGLTDTASASAASFTLLPGTKDGPSNAAAIISGTYKLGGTQTLQLATYYYTGPRLQSRVQFLTYGTDFPQPLGDRLVVAQAGRTAKG